LVLEEKRAFGGGLWAACTNIRKILIFTFIIEVFDLRFGTRLAQLPADGLETLLSLSAFVLLSLAYLGYLRGFFLAFGRGGRAWHGDRLVAL
jgi:hypothetical protein